MFGHKSSMMSEMPLEEKAKGATLRDILKIVQAMIAKEGSETPEEEKMESPDLQSMEDQLGLEQHGGDPEESMLSEDKMEDPLAKKKVMMVFGSMKAKPDMKNKSMMMKKPKYG